MWNSILYSCKIDWQTCILKLTIFTLVHILVRIRYADDANGFCTTYTQKWFHAITLGISDSIRYVQKKWEKMRKIVQHYSYMLMCWFVHSRTHFSIEIVTFFSSYLYATDKFDLNQQKNVYPIHIIMEVVLTSTIFFYRRHCCCCS